MTALRYPPAGDAVVVEFVTALAWDECLHSLTHGPLRFGGQQLYVRVQGDRVLVETGWQQRPTEDMPGLWLLRFEGVLGPEDTGTRVVGQVVRNSTLETLLTVPGLITSVFAVLGIALAVPAELRAAVGAAILEDIDGAVLGARHRPQPGLVRRAAGPRAGGP